MMSDNDSALGINYPALFIINGGDEHVSVINLDHDIVSDSIMLMNAPAPHHVYISPDKTQMAIAITATDLSGGHGGHGGMSGNFNVQIVNTITGETVKEIPLEAMPHNAVYSPDGTELWIGQSIEPRGKVHVYNTADYSLKATVDVGMQPSEVTFTWDGHTVFVANTADNTVTVIDPATKSVRKTIPVGKAPVGAWPASNGMMYVDNEESETISEIDPLTGTIVNTIDLGFMPGYVAYRSTAGELWVSDATNGAVAVYAVVAGTWTLQQKVSSGPGAHAIVFARNNTKAYITNQNDGTVSVVDAVAKTKIKDIMVGSKPNGIGIKE